MKQRVNLSDKQKEIIEELFSKHENAMSFKNYVPKINRVKNK